MPAGPVSSRPQHSRKPPQDNGRPLSPANLTVRPRTGAASHPAALRRHPDLCGQPAELAIDQVEIRVAQRRQVVARGQHRLEVRSEEHTSELQSLMRISYAVFCLKKK